MLVRSQFMVWRRGGGKSATHIIACSAWKCLLCGQAVACQFAHTRHGNMHVRIDSPCPAAAKTKLFKNLVSLLSAGKQGASDARVKFLRPGRLLWAPSNFQGGEALSFVSVTDAFHLR